MFPFSPFFFPQRSGFRASSSGSSPREICWVLREISLVVSLFPLGDRQVVSSFPSSHGSHLMSSPSEEVDAQCRDASSTRPRGRDSTFFLDARARPFLSECRVAVDFCRKSLSGKKVLGVCRWTPLPPFFLPGASPYASFLLVPPR